MSDKSAAELERDAEIARSKVADTAESIRNKLSPGQLIDEFAGLFTGGDGSLALANLKAQIRDNPLPLTLVATGIAWLMLGGATSVDRSSSAHRGYAGHSGGTEFGFNDQASAYGDDGSDAAASGNKIGEVISDAVDSATSKASDVFGAAKNAARGAKTRLSNAGGDLGERAKDMAGGTRDLAQDLFHREPLVVAALGLAVGTAIGALLPSTAVEDEQLGTYRDKIRDTADEIFEKGVKEVKEVAAETYETVKDEADKLGSKADNDATLAERVVDALKATAVKTEDVVRGKIKEATED